MRIYSRAAGEYASLLQNGGRGSEISIGPTQNAESPGAPRRGPRIIPAVRTGGRTDI